jgi:hypothetical protein
VVLRAKGLGDHDMDDRSVFKHKLPEVPQADLIDLLLDDDRLLSQDRPCVKGCH